MKRLYFLISSLVLEAVAKIAWAQARIETRIPGSATPPTNPGEFVINFYNFALMIGGILAFGVIVFGGVKYTFNAGNPSSQSDGKEWIKGALWGLGLLAGASIVLNTINPNLVNLKLPKLTPSTPTPTGGASVGVGSVGVDKGVVFGNGGAVGSTGTGVDKGGTVGGGGVVGSNSGCSLAPLAPITDPAAQVIENGATIVWASSDSNVQANLTKLQEEFNKLQNLMVGKVGGSATANSAYRPLAYQTHLYDIFQASQQYKSNPSFYDNNPGCSEIITVLKAEQQKHSICFDGHPCLVAPPNKCAPHVKGTGIDISISPKGFLNTINIFLQNNNIDLRWQALSDDPVHFNLVNQPFTGCAG